MAGVLTACGGQDRPRPGAVAAVAPGASASLAGGPTWPDLRATALATAPAAAGGMLGEVRTSWGTPVGPGEAIRVRDVSLVARSRVAQITIYGTATSTSSLLTLASPLPAGGPLVFLVQERVGDRLRVLLPVRPNGSQGWINAGDVTLTELDYRITVSAKDHRLRLYRGGALVMNEPVGLGKGTTPTPGGVYYLKELLKPSDPQGAYGPYAYGLSGYSNVLNEFLGGDGQIGIHGTNDPSSVGKDVSHGCIRMRNAAIAKLARMLPLGVPVQMIP
jgi:lipoprotein-anchoring transpeptidase ErfK/SrfK